MVSLAEVVSQIESSNFQGAMRFEPQVFARDIIPLAILSHIANINMCDMQTAKVIYSTSWGLYQIMGFNMYNINSPAYIYTIFSFFTNPDLQLKTFNWFLATNHIEYTIPQLLGDYQLLNDFALKYNGSLAYAEKIKTIYTQLSAE